MNIKEGLKRGKLKIEINMEEIEAKSLIKIIKVLETKGEKEKDIIEIIFKSGLRVYIMQVLELMCKNKINNDKAPGSQMLN